jgi:hypothetical protein
MNLHSNRLLRLSMIAAVALATAPATPTIALAAGQSFDRCESVEFQGNRLAPAGETFFDGYIRVDAHGEINWTCLTGSGAIQKQTDCGMAGVSQRRARGELRDGVFYFGCA